VGEEKLADGLKLVHVLEGELDHGALVAEEVVGQVEVLLLQARHAGQFLLELFPQVVLHVSVRALLSRVSSGLRGYDEPGR
jgi:hypothetical protein